MRYTFVAVNACFVIIKAFNVALISAPALGWVVHIIKIMAIAALA